MSAQDHLEPELDRVPLRECAYALSLVLAVFAAWAWLESGGIWAWGAGTGEPAPQAAGFVLLAVLSFIVQIAANIAAAAARQAQAAKLGNEFFRARVLMLLGGAYNAVSLHHAFELVGFLAGDWAPLAWGLAVSLAFYEPAQYWIDEALAHVRAERIAKREAAEQAFQDTRERDRRAHLLALEEAQRRGRERETAQALMSAPSAPARTGAKVVPLASARRKKSVVAQVAKAAAIGGVMLSGAAAAKVARPHAPPVEPAPRTQNLSGVTPAQRAEAKALLAQGVGPSEVARQTGVPPGTCRRYACELRAA